MGLATGIGPATAEQIVVIDGRGFGHGVGMAQDGAYWLGRSGRTATDILRVFYPGTTTANRSGSVRVPLLSSGSVTIGFPSGGTLDGRSVAPGSTALISPAGGGLTARVVSGAVATGSSSVPTTTALASTRPSRPSRASRASKVQRLLSRPLGRLRLESSALEDATTVPPSSGPPVSGALTPPQNVAPPIAIEAEQPSTTTTTEAPTTVADSISGSSGADGGDASPGKPLVTTTTHDGPTAVLTPKPLLVATAARGDVVTIGARRYRGTLEMRPQGGVRVVNELDVEQYLRGMGEIRTPDWPSATLQSQAIAARTFALRTMASAGEVCPTQRCQVYLGAQAEYPQMDAAVAATSGKVLTYHGALAATFYSASGGGTIATPEEAFGSAGSNLTYLRAGAYPTGDVLAWTRRFSMTEASRRLGYSGTLRSLTITATGPSGRATEVTLDGDAGTIRKSGIEVTSAFGLRSNAYRITTQEGALDSAPVPDNIDGTGVAGGVAIDGGVVDAADAGAQLGLLAPTTDTTTPASDSVPIGTVVTAQAVRASDNTSLTTAIATTTPPPQVARGSAASRTQHPSSDHAGDIVIGALTFGLVVLGLSGLRRTRRGRHGDGRH